MEREKYHGAPLDPAAVTAHRAPGRIRRSLLAADINLVDYVAANQALLDQLVGYELARQARENTIRDARHTVQFSGTAVLDATGAWDHTIQTGSAAIFVVNTSANPLTVFSGPRQPAAPTAGAGVHIIPANTALTVNAPTTAWTLYGVAGASISVQIFGKPLTPFASSV